MKKKSINAKLLKLESGQRYQRLISKDFGSCGIKAGHVILNPGENIGLHSTKDREEILIILKGKGKAYVDKKTPLSISENHILYIPPKTGHDIHNKGTGVLEYVFITSAVT